MRTTHRTSSSLSIPQSRRARRGPGGNPDHVVLLLQTRVADELASARAVARPTRSAGIASGMQHAVGEPAIEVVLEPPPTRSRTSWRSGCAAPDTDGEGRSSRARARPSNPASAPEAHHPPARAAPRRAPWPNTARPAVAADHRVVPRPQSSSRSTVCESGRAVEPRPHGPRPRGAPPAGAGRARERCSSGPPRRACAAMLVGVGARPGQRRPYTDRTHTATSASSNGPQWASPFVNSAW